MAFYPEQILDTIALCEGYDGIGLGLSLIEPAYRNICGVEREIFPVANMVKKTKKIFLDEKPQWSDVSTFRIPRLRGLVDCITAGIPCQPFSCAGKQRGLADARWIWPSIFRIIDDIRPGILFFEEVSGFKKHGLPVLLRDIAKIGYDAVWDNFRAPDVEAPHKKRERIFILARLANTDSGRRSSRWAESAGQRRDSDADESSSQSEGLDNPLGRDCRTRTERSGRAQGSNADGAGSGTGLAHPHSEYGNDAGLGTSEICGKRSATSEIFGNRERLGHSTCRRSGASRTQENKTESDSTLSGTGSGVGQADTDNEGLQRCWQYDECSRKPLIRSPGCENRIWPARDGEPQYGWEPPRTINVKSKQAGNKDWLLPFEPSLGRNAYGYSSRVDELRLCGNGVLPTMAGLAWFVLKTILIENGIW